jgi:signal peptidase I
MNIDLAFWLVLLVIVTGFICLLDKIFWQPKRTAALNALSDEATEEEIDTAGKMNFAVDLSCSLFPIFLIVLVLRSFAVEPFRIPSGSMMPTLLIGDFILVNKYEYGLRLPVLNTKILDVGEPERGDVVVFRYPEDPKIPFIKRVVGLPGDDIFYNNITKQLYINGEEIETDYVGIYQGVGAGSGMTGHEERLEHLTDVPHKLLIDESRPYPGLEIVRLTVPENEYFVLGDNRDNSRDSRFWGTVPEANLIGKAFIIWMNGSLQGGFRADWTRIGLSID